MILEKHLGIHDQIFSLEFWGKGREPRPSKSFSTTAHKTVLLDIFFHELFVKFWSQSIIHESFVLFCFVYPLGTILEDNIIIPSENKKFLSSLSLYEN